MYEYISGKLVRKEPTFAIIETGGIGYHIRISLQTSANIGQKEFCKLYIYFHVREAEQTLYGFENQEERALFLLLISISGIGPNTGLMILSSLSPSEIKEAILSGDAKLIQSVKGIGAKTAQRVILELKDKIQKLEILGTSNLENQTTIPKNSSKSIRSEALEALMMLGFTKSIAEKSLNMVAKKHGENLSVEEMIRFALKTK